jgi:hypothetical protein
MRALIDLPVAKKEFGGIVGSRIEICPSKEVLVQIAYLEKGKSARVRYTEQRQMMQIDLPAQALELKLTEVQILDGDTNKTRLSLEIVCASENKRKVPKGQGRSEEMG